jgi:hypothetical protein
MEEPRRWDFGRGLACGDDEIDQLSTEWRPLDELLWIDTWGDCCVRGRSEADVDDVDG